MPQLDFYIICNMLYSVIFMFIVIYILNTSNILIIINLVLRMRKLKNYLDKRYVYLLLKESLVKINLRFQLNIFKFKYLKIKFIQKYLITEEFLNFSNINKNLKERKKK